MASCKECLFYNQEYSDFVALHEDSTAEKEKPKAHFCQIYADGIPDGIWNGKESCKRGLKKDPSEE